MNEHSVFVPLGDERIAAVLCLPETGDALGLWVLMPGQGAPRSTQYHFRFWTELARRLAERGVASIRMDHLGVGDSTRRLEVMAPDPGREQEPLAVAAFGMAAVGTEVLGFAGHCYGGRLAVEAAMVHPRAIGVVASHYAPPVERAAVRPTRRLRYRIRSWPPVARLSTTAFGRRVLEPIVSAVFGRSRGIAGGGERFDAGLRRLLGRAGVVLMNGDDEARYHLRLRPFLDRYLPTLDPRLAGRLESVLLPAKDLGGYMALEAQRIELDVMVDRIVRLTISPRVEPVALGDPTR